MPTQKLSAEILTAAIEGFEQQKIRIDTQIAELRDMLLGGRTEPTATPEVPKGNRRKLSAAARKRIGDAQRKRWAASKKAAEPSTSEAAPKRKRKLSAAGRRAIAEATKKRWAAFHAAKAAEKPAVAKKSTAKKAVTKKSAAKKTAVKAPVKVAAKKTAVAKTAVKKSPTKIATTAEGPAVVAAQ
jgi:histone H1/5